MLENIEQVMLERGQRLQLIQEKMNTVEDEVFGEFCQEIGVDNIRYMVQTIKYSCFIDVSHIHANSCFSNFFPICFLVFPIFFQFFPHLFPSFSNFFPICFYNFCRFLDPNCAFFLQILCSLHCAGSIWS